MKKTSYKTSKPLFAAILAALGLTTIVPCMLAANITKSASGTDLTAGASWSGAVAPTNFDVATWDTGSLGTGLTLNSGTPSWLGIKVNAGASDPIAIGSGGTLTLGAGGIDMSAAAINASISSGLTLGAGNQTWNVKSPARTLTVSGTFTRTSGATLFASTNATGGIGTITFSPTLLNIVVPWAFMANAGTGANNSAAGYTLATVSGGNLVAYLAATPMTTTASAWGGIPSGGSGLINYDISIAGTPGQTGLGRNVNSLRYTGSGMNQQGNNTGVLLNANTILNAGSGTFTLASGGSVFGITPSSTTANELVLVAASAGIDIYAYIANNVNPGKVTIAGPNTVTLRGANTFTSDVNVNSGTLVANRGNNSVNPTSSALGNPQSARNIIVNNGGTLQFVAGDTLGGANSTVVSTLVINNGGVVTNNNTVFTTFGPIQLNGGTLTGGGGAAVGYQMYNLRGTVTVGGNSMSTIAGSGSLAGYHLAAPTVFNVADVTSGTDLLVSGSLTNRNATDGGVGSLTKMGAGTMTLSGTNTYTGTTTISNGTLAIISGGSLISTNIFVNSGATFDVSAISYTLGAGQTISGFGVITGNVTTASSTASIASGNAGTGTNTFKNNLDMSAGGTATFDLSTTVTGDNDRVTVNGNLTLSSSDAIHINALSGSLDLADYVLFAVSGTTTMSTLPTLLWDGSVPGNSANYSLLKVGNNVVLHYSTSTAPVVVSGSVSPSSAYRNQPVTVTANVTKGSGTIVSVTVDLTQIGGSSTAGLVVDGANSSDPNYVYTNTFTVSAGTALGDKSLTVTATDDTSPTPLTGSYIITPLSIVVNTTVTWDGGAIDDKWGSTTNWTSDIGPGLVGDAVTFTGSTRLTPDLTTNYSVTSVTFDAAAGSFTNGTSNGSTLTVGSGGIVNNSSSPQIFNVPVVAGAAQTLNAASGNVTINSNVTLGGNLLTADGAANNTLAGTVNGTAGLTKSGSGTLILSASNGLTGTVTLNAGTIVSANTNALTSTTRINLPGNATGTLSVATDGGDGVIKIGMGSGTTIYNLVSDRATAGAGISHPLSVLAGNGLGGGTLNFTAGANVTSGTAAFTFDALGMGAGSVQTTILNPTTATVSIGAVSKFNNTLAQTLQLDGTSSGNVITGVVANGTATVSISKQNSSTWTLSGANTYTGGTTLGNGQLNINNNTALGTGAFVITAGTIDNTSAADVTLGAIAQTWNGDFTYAGSLRNLSLGTGAVTLNATPQVTVSQNTLTVGGAISGAGQGLTKTGNGTLMLGGANTYSGSTTVNAGKITSVTTGSSASAFSIASGTTNEILLAAAGGAWTNSSSVTHSAGSRLEFNFQSFIPSTNVAPANVNSFVASSTVAVVIKGLSANFTVGQTNPLVTWTGSGPANTNAFSLVMPVRLTGHLTVSGNTLALVVDSNTGPLSWNVGNGNWDTATANWVDSLLSPATFIDGNDAVLFGDASGATGNPVVTLNAALSPVRVTMNSASHDYTLNGSGGIIGSSTLSVQNGTLTVATTNAYTGVTTVSGGKLQISGNGTMGAANGSLNVVGGTVDLGATSRSKGAVTIGSGTISNGVLSATSFAATNSGAVSLSAVLSGAGALTKTANGTLTLVATNDYTGGTVVSGGTLLLSGNGTLGATNNALTVNGGTLDFGGLTTPMAGAVTISGGTISNGTLTAITSYAANNAGDASVSANLAGAVGLTKTGAGTLTISSANNTYTGTTTIGTGGNPAVIRAAATQALGTGTIQFDFTGNATTARLELTNGITLANAIALTGRNNSGVGIQSLSDGNSLPGVITLGSGGSAYIIQSDVGTLTLGTAFATAISSGASGSRTVTVQGAGNGNVAGVINDGVATPVSLVVNGSGTWTLAGANTYSGTTTISNGTLLVNGSTSLGAVTAKAGVLGGTGTIAGSVTVNSGATLSPGASIGTLTVNGALALNAGSTNVFEVNGTSLTKDMVAAGSSVTYGGVLKIIPSGTFTAGQQFQLFSGAGATNTGNFASIEGSPGGGMSFSFTNGVLKVVSSAPSPEPIVSTFDAGSGKLVLSWSQSGWTLESQTNNLAAGLNPAGWTPVSGATSPFTNTVNAANGSVFYRLKY